MKQFINKFSKIVVKFKIHSFIGVYCCLLYTSIRQAKSTKQPITEITNKKRYGEINHCGTRIQHEKLALFILFIMGWPQMITGILGLVLAYKLHKRIFPDTAE